MANRRAAALVLRDGDEVELGRWARSSSGPAGLAKRARIILLAADGLANYEIATGKVTGLCKARHRHQEFLAFLKHVARAYPQGELHLVMDNYATHKRPEVRDWLAANTRIHVHFTPTSGSWLNLVEIWFGIIERQAIRRGTFTSVRDLMTKIRQFINGWNPRRHPFIWTKSPDDTLTKIKRKQTSTTGH